MGYATFGTSSKSLIKSSDIGNGQIQLSHLDPSLFSEIRKIALHNHSGVQSRRIDMRDLTGQFGKDGFFIYSSDGTKRYKLTIDSSLNAIVLTIA